MCSASNELNYARRRSPMKGKMRSKEYLFGPISPDDVEWAKAALDANAQVKRQAAKELELDRISTADSETITSRGTEREACVTANDASIKELITNVQELSLKLGAETRQRESLEQQVAQLREHNKQLMAELDKAYGDKQGIALYTSAVEAIKKLDVKQYGQDCEEIMDVIYTAICDAFGAENNLALLFEEMADIYLKSETKHELEVQALNKQIDFLTQFESVIKGDAKPDSKAIDVLVEQLRTTKEEAAQEIETIRKHMGRIQKDYAELEMRNKNMEQAFEVEREELNVKVKVHQDRYHQLLRDQGRLLSQLPLLKLTATEEDAEDHVLRQSGANMLEAIVNALYRKDAEMQKLIKHKDEMLQQQQSVINTLQARIKEWEADAILWLDYVNQHNAQKCT